MFPCGPSGIDAAAALLRGPAPMDAHADLGRIAAEGREVAARVAADQARLVALAARAEELSGTLSARSVSSWLAWQWGLTGGESRRLTLLAEKLPGLPGIRGAFSGGQVSEATALALVRVATPDNEADLLELAASSTASQLQALLRRFTSTPPAAPPKPESDGEAPDGEGPDGEAPDGEGPDGAAESADEPDASADPVVPPLPDDECITFLDDEGTLHGRFRLAGVRGAQVASALQAMFDELRGAAPATPVTNADALVAMALAALDTTRRGDGSLADRYLISILVDAEGAHIPGHGPMSMAELKALLPEALVSLLIAENGIPTTVTSPRRLATREQRITLGWRDKTCRFPGCGRMGRLRAHHVRFSTRGGKTKLHNLLYVCDTHHTEIHQHDYDLVLERDGRLVVTKGGQPVRNKHHRPPPGVAPPRGDEPRFTGSGERLTRYGSCVLLEHWRERLAA